MKDEKTNRLREDFEAPQVKDDLILHDGALDSEAESFEGRVSEIAKTSASEVSGDNAGKTQQQAQSSTQDDATMSDRAILRGKLLKNAPAPPELRRQITQKLTQKRDDLEVGYKKYSRKKDYHMLSVVLGQLRAVLKQIEGIAKLSLEALKDMWLQVVHNFA